MLFVTPSHLQSVTDTEQPVYKDIAMLQASEKVW